MTYLSTRAAAVADGGGQSYGAALAKQLQAEFSAGVIPDCVIVVPARSASVGTAESLSQPGDQFDWYASMAGELYRSLHAAQFPATNAARGSESPDLHIHAETETSVAASVAASTGVPGAAVASTKPSKAAAIRFRVLSITPATVEPPGAPAPAHDAPFVIADDVSDRQLLPVLHRRLPATVVLPEVTRWISPQCLDALLAGLRDSGHAQILVAQSARPDDADELLPRWSAARFFSLGFQRRRSVQPQTDADVFHYSLRNYKSTPDWFNSKYWAHPERWKA